MTNRLGIGPQYDHDDKFTARMRFHQSWWRSKVLRAPYGAGPEVESRAEYGNFLDADGAARGRNFLDETCWEVYRRHSGDGVEAFRCERNLLSSQPMCFNLFGPLTTSWSLASALVGALVPHSVADAQARIEWQQPDRMELLGDRTAFDAFIEYRNASGRREFLGIETKLTDRFSTYDGENAEHYAALARLHPDVWPERSHEALWNVRWRQLWRNHLLVERLVVEGGYDRGHVVVVHHPGDGRTIDAIDRYRALLGPAGAVLRWPLQEIVEAWTPILAGDEQRRTWLEAFDSRYVTLDASRAALRHHRAETLRAEGPPPPASLGGRS